MSIVVIGAGGFGREVMVYIKSHPIYKDLTILGFVDDGLKPGTTINGEKVLGGVDFLLDHKSQLNVFIGIANPQIKESIVLKLSNTIHTFPKLIHPTAIFLDPANTHLGMGTIIGPACILSTNIVLGNFVTLNIRTTLCHDVSIGNFCTLMPNVAITGGGILECNSFIGTGVSLFEHEIRIEKNSKILPPIFQRS